MPATDPVDRMIQYTPSKAPHDPRWMLAGRTSYGQLICRSCDSYSIFFTYLFVGDSWESGFFDQGSFIETLGNWAQTVVCGRARCVCVCVCLSVCVYMCTKAIS